MFSIPRIKGVNVQDTEHSDKPDTLGSGSDAPQIDLINHVRFLLAVIAEEDIAAPSRL